MDDFEVQQRGASPRYDPWQPMAWQQVPPPQPRRRRGLRVALAATAAVGVLGVAAAGSTLGQVASKSIGSLASGTVAALPAVSSDSSRTTGVVDVDSVLGNENAAAAGTGMVLTAAGEVLTNNHVVDGATSIAVTDVSTGHRYSASVVGTDAADDIAVLQLRNATGLTPIAIGDSSTVTVGQQVVATGNAGGKGGTPSVVRGSVTALNQTITATNEDGTGGETLTGLIEVDANIVAGDSGGPLTDTAGKVIGMDSAAATSTARVGSFGRHPGESFGNSSQSSAGYAIPIAKALTVAKQIESGQSDSGSTASSSHGYLGVEVADADSGAIVSGTVDGSPAAGAGVAAGDVITSVNGQSVDSASALSALLANSHVGDRVRLGWLDQDGSSNSATVTLMAGSG